ncbi:hypothetical protein HDU97_007699 [Phlyctochytrium planicorne]|nr:hypothetical protein HDU97_007699 [Phlyctochytrium planicorne]
MLDCFKSFPVSAKDRTDQIDTLLALAEIYPSTTAVKDKVDLIASLKSIAADTTLTSELDFQTKVTNLITSLNDGHFAYSPACFSAIQFFQPWVIAAKYDASGKPTLYLNDLITKGSSINVEIRSFFPNVATAFSTQALDAWTTAIGQDPSLLIGYTIDAIDGGDPIAAVQSWVDTYVGVSHTAESRFNYGVAARTYSKGDIALKDGAFVNFATFTSDKAPSRKYTLRSPTGTTVTVDAPWLGLFPAPQTIALTSTKYRNAVCGATVAARAGTYTGPPDSVMQRIAHINGLVEDEEALKVIRANKFSKAALQTKPPALLVSDDFDGFYYLADSKTGVFALPGFAPTGEITETKFVNWLNTWTEGLVALEKKGAVNLIIDTTNNGGGIICSGKSLLSYLFKDSKFVQYDVRLTPTVDFLTANGALYKNASNPFDMSKVLPAGSSTSSSAIKAIKADSRSFTRNGVKDTYSGLFDIDCKSIQDVFNGLEDVGVTFPQLSKGWAPENVALVGNGFCGSTCAESTRALRAQYGIKTYVYGGFGKTYQPTSFEGGSVIQYGPIIDSAQTVASRVSPAANAGVLIPAPFALPVSGQVLFWESYSNGASQETPDEWTVQPADEYIKVSDSTEIVEVWNAVAAKLPTSNAGAGTSSSPSTPSGPRTPVKPATTTAGIPGKNSGAGSLGAGALGVVVAVVALLI